MRPIIPLLIAFAAAPLSAAVPPSTHDVQRQTLVDGARATVDALVKSERWEPIIARISAGDTKWIALTPDLAEGTDAGTSEELTIALAGALTTSPAAVLAVIGHTQNFILEPDQVCGIPFIEQDAAEQARYKASALHALAKVQDRRLRAINAECQADLRG